MARAETARAGRRGALDAALARLDRLVDWERRDRAPTQGSGMRQSVDPARDLCARLGDPQRRLRCVHVAGTKGKGSVCALVEAALVGVGVHAGRYASPHVERVNERISIGAAPIADPVLADVLVRSLDAREAALAEGTAGREANWFDVLTAAALLALAEAGVEVAVLECGLGGRLDSTNVVEADVCVVTNIDLEHTEILGATRAAIAAEKAAIASPGCSLVTGVPAGDPAGDAVDAAAAAAGARLVRPLGDGAWPGFRAANRRLAGAVLDALHEGGLAPGGAALLEGVTAALPGRLERFEAGGTPVVLDGAHVPSSAARLLEELDGAPGLEGPAVAVVGLGRDKDVAGILKTLAGRADTCMGTSAGDGRHLDPEQVVRAAQAAGLAGEAVPDPEEALTRALALARPAGWVLVVGSLHLAGVLRPSLAAGPVDAPEEPPC